MIFFLLAAASQTATSVAEPQARQVTYRNIDCWIGEATWTDKDEPLSDVVIFRTESEPGPTRIKHNRDLILVRGNVQENYNFIDYEFADGGQPLFGRTYLDEPDLVSITLVGVDQPNTVAEARRAIPAPVLCYFQKRFSRLDVLTKQGYEKLWSLDD